MKNKFLQNSLPWLVTLLLVIGCAWLLAQITWHFFDSSNEEKNSIYSSDKYLNKQDYFSSNLGIKKQNTASQNLNITALTNRHLFGQKAVATVTAPPKVVKPKNEPIVETSLKNLKLVGVMASKNPVYARAIIKNGARDAKVFAIESEIINGAVLKEVNLDHVIINRNGALETLSMAKAAGSKTASSRRNNQSTTSSNRGANNFSNRRSVNNSAEPVAQRINTARQAIMADFSKASNYLRYRPQMQDGKVVGYRIYPGKERALFRDVGLRSGDLVKAINGIPLSDTSQAMALIPQLQTATSVDVTFERQGKEQTININAN